MYWFGRTWRWINNDRTLLIWVNYHFKAYVKFYKTKKNNDKLRKMHHVTTWQRKNKQLLVIDFKALFEVFSFASFLLFIQQETVPLFFPLKMTCIRSLCTLIHYSNTLHTRSLHLHAVEGLSFLYDIRTTSKVSSITEIFQAIKNPWKNAFKRKDLLIKKQR